MLSLFLSALLLQPASSPPPAQHAAPACTETDGDLPANLTAWRNPGPLASVVRAGQAVIVAPATTPVTLEIAEAGTYGIAIDQGAWIDVARDGAMLHSAMHGHGPDCATIRKIVDFQLQPGRYTITLSRTQNPSARLLVVRR
jgi:hypothetical protein